MRISRPFSLLSIARILFVCSLALIPYLHSQGAYAQQDDQRGAMLMTELASYGSDVQGAGAYWNSLSPEDQGLLMWGWDNMTVEVTLGESSGDPEFTASGCADRWATQSWSAYGVTQFSFTSGTHWCWTSSYVYNIWSDGTRPVSGFAGWTYNAGGLGGGVEDWGDTAYKFSQTQWDLCYAWCIQHKYPWIASYGDTRGSFWWNYGGA